MDKHTKSVLDSSPFPICVTQALPMAELTKWRRHFKKQGIEFILKEQGPNKFAIYREVTKDELKELEEGEWVLRGNSFCSPEQGLNRKRPGPINHE